MCWLLVPRAPHTHYEINRGSSLYVNNPNTHSETTHMRTLDDGYVTSSLNVRKLMRQTCCLAMAAVANAPMLKSTLACRTGGPCRAVTGGVGRQVKVLQDQYGSPECHILSYYLKHSAAQCEEIQEL